MRAYLNNILLKSEFAKDTFTLTLGTSIAQFVPMLFYPILSRIFKPVDFGILATLSTITSLLTVLVTGNYENSILIAKTKKDAANIVGLVLTLSTITLFLSYIVLELFSNRINEWFNEPNLKKWLFVCPINALSIIVYNCFNEWCIRNKYFRNLSINKITNSTATSILKLSFGFVKIAGNGLVVGDLLGRIISAIGCIIRGLQKDGLVFRQLSPKRMLKLARDYSEFPKITLPANLVNAIGGALPVLIIGAYFGPVKVGYYAMTTFVLSVPISVISLAVKDVFRQRANEEFVAKGSCDKTFKKLVYILTFLGFFGSIPIFFALPQVFSLVLGENWRIAGEYSQILLPMITINFVCTSLSGVLIITKRMIEVIYLEIYYTGITIFSLLLACIVFREIKTVLIFFSIGRSTSYLFSLIISYKYSKGIYLNEQK